MVRQAKKEEIYEWIKENLKFPLSIKQIAEKMGISYYTALKWIHVLSAEGKLKIGDYGNVKVVYPLKKKEVVSNG